MSNCVATDFGIATEQSGSASNCVADVKGSAVGAGVGTVDYESTVCNCSTIYNVAAVVGSTVNIVVAAGDCVAAVQSCAAYDSVIESGRAGERRVATKRSRTAIKSRAVKLDWARKSASAARHGVGASTPARGEPHTANCVVSVGAGI